MQNHDDDEPYLQDYDDEPVWLEIALAGLLGLLALVGLHFVWSLLTAGWA